MSTGLPVLVQCDEHENVYAFVILSSATVGGGVLTIGLSVTCAFPHGDIASECGPIHEQYESRIACRRLCWRCELDTGYGFAGLALARMGSVDLTLMRMIDL